MNAKEVGAMPAYPSDEGPYNRLGLTKREVFALAAMQGLVTAKACGTVSVVMDAITIADRMLAELAKPQP